MNKQQIFDKVATHLLNQGQRSEDNSGFKCAYRGVGGLKCAAGCLIPDTEYDQTQESVAWSHTSFSSKFSIEENEFIDNLQRIHDFELPKHWGLKLHDIAVKHDLDPSASKI